MASGPFCHSPAPTAPVLATGTEAAAVPCPAAAVPVVNGGCKDVAAAAVAGNAVEDRSHRKKKREKERRQEVNDRFDELAALVASVETSLRLAPAAGGLAGATSSNRVDLLSRAIAAMRRLWNDCGAHRVTAEQLMQRMARMQHERAWEAAHGSPAAAARATAASALLQAKMEHVADAADESATVAATTPAAACAGGSSVAMDGSHVAAPAVPPAAPAMVPVGAPGLSPAGPHPHALPLPPHLHHHRYHAVHMPAGMHGVPGMPMLIALPMYMPAGAPDAAPGALKPKEDSPTVPVPAGVVVTGGGGKPGFPAGAFSHMVPVPMPQFAVQALSADGPEEKPTHAVCA
ncbi:unnamed protein product [Phaeothamnion confervicola]